MFRAFVLALLIAPNVTVSANFQCPKRLIQNAEMRRWETSLEQVTTPELAWSHPSFGQAQFWQSLNSHPHSQAVSLSREHLSYHLSRPESDSSFQIPLSSLKRIAFWPIHPQPGSFSFPLDNEQLVHWIIALFEHITAVFRNPSKPQFEWDQVNSALHPNFSTVTTPDDAHGLIAWIQQKNSGTHYFGIRKVSRALYQILIPLPNLVPFVNHEYKISYTDGVILTVGQFHADIPPYLWAIAPLTQENGKSESRRLQHLAKGAASFQAKGKDPNLPVRLVGIDLDTLYQTTVVALSRKSVENCHIDNPAPDKKAPRFRSLPSASQRPIDPFSQLSSHEPSQFVLRLPCVNGSKPQDQFSQWDLRIHKLKEEIYFQQHQFRLELQNSMKKQRSAALCVRLAYIRSLQGRLARELEMFEIFLVSTYIRFLSGSDDSQKQPYQLLRRYKQQTLFEKPKERAYFPRQAKLAVFWKRESLDLLPAELSRLERLFFRAERFLKPRALHEFSQIFKSSDSNGKAVPIETLFESGERFLAKQGEPRFTPLLFRELFQK